MEFTEEPQEAASTDAQGQKKIMEQAVPLGMEFQDELRWQEARMEKKK